MCVSVYSYIQVNRWLIVCQIGFITLLFTSTIAGAQVPTVDPLSVTTPAPTHAPNALPGPTATSEPSDEAVVDELSATSDVAPDLTHGFSRARYYTVRPGDTLLSVALEAGINLDEMWCVVAPAFSGEEPLVIGDILEIPTPDVACHRVTAGETLMDIAANYNTLPTEITTESWNRLTDDTEQPLAVGHHLRIPLPIDPDQAGEALRLLLAQPVGKSLLTTMSPVNAEKVVDVEVPDEWPFGSGYFRWPVSGWLSQGYHGRHRALDIATPLGTVVTAADRGEVIRAGWNYQGYGNLVIVDHKNDFLTLYAHLSEVLVEEGQIVGAGELIGKIGSTGNSTGPHLHFEIRDYGKLVDPLVLLTR